MGRAPACLRAIKRGMVASNVSPFMAGNTMRRAIVIGGSLGGLFAGATLLRSGWDVTIVYRSGGRLEGRGAGLGVHPPMLQGLLAAGAEVDGGVGIAVGGRTAFAPDGSIVGELSMPQFCTSWGRLYAMLMAAFPEERIRFGMALAGFVEDHNGVTARFVDGSELRADVLIGADGVRSTVRRQMFPDIDLVSAGYIAWRGMVEEAALTPSTHAALFHRFGWGLLAREHILGYPVPGAFDDLTPGRRRYSFVWYRPVDSATTLAEMQTDSAGRVHSEGIPPQLIRPAVIAALRRDAEAMAPPVFAEIVRLCEQPLFQPIGDLESPAMRLGRVALLGDAAFVARPHVAKGAIKAGHDAIELAAALARETVEDGLARYDEARRPASAQAVAESRRLGAYIEGNGKRADPLTFMGENGGVESANRDDGGLFFDLLAKAGFG
jgi:2-polyprenyl-6-methoxyphenol hydroxylase-like FAD-dependent oxidoreductase